MPNAPQRALSLPEEFLLLAHQPSGEVLDNEQAEYGSAAAELAELALLRRVVVKARKFRLFGLEVYQIGGHTQLLDASYTGLAWADGIIAELASQGTAKRGRGAVPVRRWLAHRAAKAFSLHRDALMAKGMLLPSIPGQVSYDGLRYPVDAVRHALTVELRDAYSGQRPFDERLRLLGDLVDGAEMTELLGLSLSSRLRMDWARSRGVMAMIPEQIRDTATVLGTLIPSRNRRSGAVGGGGDGGDGGGGGE